ncbi:hypothetical protein [Paraburkholderia sartisoli]|uniref:Filamentous hemagglutinin n=1 Tax=Paraburkholderia sartisoli TaxID=83784 RepID=A0A1H3YJT1_9BURK|nr:hypothetical protein [Paraburkholderia sartisoli]SEA11198.1 filamentous hemagglutinin [Paraburkholderia sartisoli]
MQQQARGLVATRLISQNSNGLFTATPAEYNSPFLYGNSNHSLTPEQAALPGAVANPAAGLAAAALITGGLAAGPALAALPGAPIFSASGILGSGTWVSPVGTGLISAGSQYLQNGTINPVDLATSFGTGMAGAYGGLAWNVFVNGAGGAAGTAINNVVYGKNDSIIGSGITSGAFSTVGYGAGLLTGNTINSAMRPTIDNAGSWVSTGVWSGGGYNIFNPNNTAVIGAGFLGGTMQEIIQSTISNMQKPGSGK